MSDADRAEHLHVSSRFDKMRDVEDVPSGTGDVPPPDRDPGRDVDPDDEPLLDVMPPGEL